MAVVSVLWRHAMTPLIGGGYQYVTVYPLIILVAIATGRGPAILHALLASMLTTHYFSDIVNLPAALVLFVAVATGVCAGDLSQRFHNALRQAQQHAAELAERESLIQSISRNTDVLIAAIDQDFRFIFLNEAYRRGWEEMWQQQIHIGTNLLEVTDPWPREQWKGKELWNRALRGESFRATVDFGASEHKKRLFDIYFNPIYDAQGRQVGAAQILRDITEQAEIQRQLAESELFYRQTLESIPGMVFTTRPDGYCDYQSRQWVEYTGVPMKDMLGDGWNRLLHPDDRAGAYQAWQAALADLAPYDLEYRVRRYDGLYEWFKARGQPIHDAEGNVVRWFGVAANVNDLKKTEAALRRSEFRFRGTFENAAVGITHVDLDGNWIDVNQKFCDMVGYTRQALIGTSFLILTLPEDLQEDLALFDALRKGERDSYFVEKRYVHKDGHVLWVDMYHALQRDENGAPLYCIAVVIDITDRKRTEEALRQSEQQFHSMFDRHCAVKLVIDPDTGVICDANQAAAEFYGYSRQQLCTMRIDEINQLTEEEIVAERRLAAEEKRNYFIFPHRLADGTMRTVEVYSTPVPIGGKTRLYSIIHDITERRKAEKSLAESEERLRKALMIETVGVLFFDTEGRFLDANDAFLRMIGYDRETLKQGQLNSAQVTLPEWMPMTLRAFQEVKETGRLSPYEKQLVRPDGTLWWGLFAGTRLGENEAVEFVIDITERKRAEEDLLRYKNRLESKNREMESIIGIVSHDLRAPLVNIQGFSHEIEADCRVLDTMLKRVPVEQEVEQQLDRLLHHNIPESLQYVQTSAGAMNRLVVTLVEVARAGMTPTRLESIDMNALMDEIVDNLTIKFKEADVAYTIEPLPDCYADRTQVTQIFTNLLDNAIKYLSPDRRGAICVRGATQAHGVLYEVCDNGIGISPEEQEKIFEPYYQLKEKAAGGVGMGLATVKKLVERNNGSIWVLSEKGRYSSFYVALPAVQP